MFLTDKSPRAVGTLSSFVLALGCVVAGVCLLTAGPAVASPPTPVWGIIASSQPTNFAPGGKAQYLIEVTNVGSGPTDGSAVTVTDTLPNGLTPTGCLEGFGYNPCAISGQTVTSTGTGVVEPGQLERVAIRVEVTLPAAETVLNTVSVSGGGAPTVTTTEPTTIGSALPFGVASFSAPVIFSDGTPDTQAGGHPYSFTTNISYNTIESANTDSFNDPSTISGEVKDLHVTLPLGLVGNPQALPQCTQDQFRELSCPVSSQVGVTHTDLSASKLCSGCLAIPPLSTAVYNMVPPPGVPAQFAFSYNVGGIHVRTRFNARVHSGGDYGVTVVASGISQSFPLLATPVTIWGVPADPSHDDQRCREPGDEANVMCDREPGTFQGPNPSTAPLKPFLTMPTACPGTPLRASAEVDSWEEPGNFVSGGKSTQPAVEGCGKLSFEPGLEAQPTSTLADSPSGLNVDLHVPQPDGCKEEGGGVECELAEAELRDATVTLPAGMVVDPSAADGLEVCSEAQVGYLVQKSVEVGYQQFTSEPAECPNGAKVGTVEVFSPLVNHPLPGAVYVAAQDANPFKSLLALYVAVYDPATGVVIKLAGKVGLDPVTGRLTTTFDENPQLPFSDFKLDFFSGSRAALTTPFTCGSYAASSVLTPWSAPEGRDAEPSSLPFAVSGAPGGGACVDSEAQAPNAPVFEAGTASPVAGSYSPFVLTLKREDASQRFSGLNVTLPPGLLGKIAGIEQCSQAAIEAAQGRSHEGEGALELAHPSCPAGSEVGVVHVGTGSGAPEYVAGHAYFAGRYEGAPFSLVIVTPALAGPFDFGSVVVRAALYINPSTAQVTVKSDPFPRILDGVPLDIRDVSVDMNRSQFTLNPTSCATMAVTGEESSTAGSTAVLSDRFQAGGCATLPFNPSFTASTSGKASRAQGASLNVKLVASPGEANVGKVDVQLPSQLPSRLTTLRKACTEAQFNTNPAGCPAASDVATATVHTPILNVPLTGPAYFVSHGNAAFPELVLVLQGENVTIDLVGDTDIKGGVTYSRFEAVPDAPFTSFELNAPQGPYSILGANLPASAKYSLCGQNLTMPTVLTGQNGAVVKQATKLGITGCPPTRAKVVKKALTRAQKRKAAMRVCRTKDRGKSRAKWRKRETCEKAAQRKYGPVEKAKAPKKRAGGKSKGGK
jgi:uncharacterized repeat protein (TIGR01451 family)